MTPALTREERDAMRARNDRVGRLDGRHDRLWIEAAEASLDDVPALLDALDAAEAEAGRLRDLTGGVLDQYDRLVEVHSHVVMDTPEDRELHDRTVATFGRYSTAARNRLAALAVDGAGHGAPRRRPWRETFHDEHPHMPDGECVTGYDETTYDDRPGTGQEGRHG